MAESVVPDFQGTRRPGPPGRGPRGVQLSKGYIPRFIHAYQPPITTLESSSFPPPQGPLRYNHVGFLHVLLRAKPLISITNFVPNLLGTTSLGMWVFQQGLAVARTQEDRRIYLSLKSNEANVTFRSRGIRD